MEKERSEAEEKLGEFIRDAIDHSNVELDFFAAMDHPPMPSPETFMVGKPDDPHRRWRNYAIKTAAFIVAVLLCSTALMEITQRSPAAAKPAELNIGTDASQGDGESMVFKRYAYSDESKFDLAKERAKGLLAPTYMPEGYTFQGLYIDLYTSGNWISVYKYVNKDGTLLEITMQNSEKNTYKVEFDDAGDSGQQLASGWKLYYANDEKNHKETVSCIVDNHRFITVESQIGYVEMKKIVESMK